MHSMAAARELGWGALRDYVQRLDELAQLQSSSTRPSRRCATFSQLHGRANALCATFVVRSGALCGAMCVTFHAALHYVVQLGMGTHTAPVFSSRTQLAMNYLALP